MMGTYFTKIRVTPLPGNSHHGSEDGFFAFYISVAQSETKHLEQLLAALSRAFFSIEDAYRGSDLLLPDELRGLPNFEQIQTAIQETGESLEFERRRA
jgi:hypothetical protein